jgi:D-tyrosyl-tRNA(Tyr) deacylase
VDVADERIGEIERGLVVMVGIGSADGEPQATQLADKVATLRIFADDVGRFALSSLDVRAEMLVISQFTLYADTRKGRRPSFTAAATPANAAPLVDHFTRCLRDFGLRVATGRFGAHMLVNLCNDGPVTILVETD